MRDLDVENCSLKFKTQRATIPLKGTMRFPGDSERSPERGGERREIIKDTNWFTDN